MDRAPSPARETPAASQNLARRLRPLTAWTLVFLLLQFIVGMLVNLYVVLPAQHPGSNAPEYFSGVVTGVWWALGHSGWQLTLHAGIGVVLGLLSLALLGSAIAVRSRMWIIVATLGFIGVGAAGFNGASFLNCGHDFSSLLMTIGFLLAVIAYAYGIYATKPQS